MNPTNPSELPFAELVKLAAVPAVLFTCGDDVCFGIENTMRLAITCGPQRDASAELITRLLNHGPRLVDLLNQQWENHVAINNAVGVDALFPLRCEEILLRGKILEVLAAMNGKPSK